MMQKKTEYSNSLVSKSLPVSNKQALTILFSTRYKIYYILLYKY